MRLPPIPRRALLAATVGAVYALLILPAPASMLGVTWYGVVWFVLSAGLLFFRPVSYHAYSFWAILWIVYRGIQHFQTMDIVLLATDLVLPILSAALLMTSGYIAAAADR